MRQRVSNPRLKWWQGVLLIAGLVVILSLAHLVGSVVAYMANDPNAYTAASILYWIFGGAVALVVVRAFIMDYEYSLEGLNFQVSRVYGKGKPRMAVSVITRNIVALGTPDEVGEKYPNAHPQVFTRKRSGMTVWALAYESDGKARILYIQPNDALLEKLKRCVEEQSGRKK